MTNHPPSNDARDGPDADPGDAPTPFDDGADARLDVEHLTWTVLLAHWVDFARSSLALPTDGEGKRMRDSVPDLIMLQAVWFALQHVEHLDPAERSLGLDRAEVLIDRHAAALERRWRGEALPEACRELIADARHALQRVTERDRHDPEPPPGESGS